VTDEQKRQHHDLLAAITAAHLLMRRFLDRTALAPANRIRERAIGQIVTGLNKILKGNTRAFVKRDREILVRRFIEEAVVPIGEKAESVLEDVGNDSGVEAALLLERLFRRVSRLSVTLTDAERRQRLMQAQRAARAITQAQVSRAISQELAISVLSRFSDIPITDLKGSDVVSAAAIGLDESWWKVERVVRTTANSLFNNAQTVLLEDLANEPEFAGVRSRWTELVSDSTGLPLDNRVGLDSMALHGQVARPGRLFVMPPDAPVKSSLIGGSWSHPPNRPNDRAIILPWMPGWNVPTYTMERGFRSPVK